jgi:hypothetical protein
VTLAADEREIVVGLTEAQAELLADTDSGTDQAYKLICFVGGVGAGKTRGGGLKAMQLAKLNPGCVGMVVMPTIEMLEGIFIREMLVLFEEWQMLEGVDYTYERRRKIITLYDEDGRSSRIMFRPSLDHRRLVGFNLAWAIIDEAEDNPEDAFIELGKRIRHPGARCKQLVCMGTPESLGGWFYREVEGQRRPNTHVVRASTRSNLFLPLGYADGLARHLDEASRKLYLDGHFVARSGRVYTHFDRERHVIDVDHASLDGEWVMGCDFGKGAMAWVMACVVDGTVYVVGEYAREQMDTLTAAREARQWWADYFERHQGMRLDPYKAAQQVTAYVDPAGQAGSISDVRILQDAGYSVRYHVKHPRVRDRINAVQEKLAKGELFFDADGAPYVVRCQSGQCYDKYGYPQKGTSREGLRGLDHGNDALGYLIEFRFPASMSGLVVN